ncbi:MAG: T9SS type A sorting domain-containing protein, partial [Ginsengibacter sp.]
SEYPSLSVSGLGAHVVWQDNRNGNYEIYYKRSIDGGISWGTDTRLTSNTAFSYSPSVSVSASVVHVVWTDERDNNAEIYYKRDPTGNPFGIINVNSEVPNQFSLSQNYPNPFNPTTKIQFSLPKSSFANIVVYDMLGKEIETVVNEQLNASTYQADFDGSKFASGVYYYKLLAGDYTQTKKMVLIK